MVRDLPRGVPEQHGIASQAISRFIAKLDRLQEIHSVMILRHGHVIAEGSWSPYQPETAHILFSLSKSFTSTAVGLAIDEGFFGLDDRVVAFFAAELPSEPSANLQAMRVRDLLTMSSGHATDPLDHNETNWIKAILAAPIEHEPGTQFVYNSSATYLLSAIVQRTTGQRLMDFLQPRLLAPLGISMAFSEQSPEGIDIGGWGMMMPIDAIARFGQLLLQKGMWNGRQLVPAAWLEQATSKQISNGDHPNSDWEQGYGFQYWMCRHNCFRGDGAFGQFCLVMPEHETVVAMTSGIDDMQQVLNLVWDYLLPELHAEPLPVNDDAHHALHDQLASLQLPLVAGNPTSSMAETILGKTYHVEPNALNIKAMCLDKVDDRYCFKQTDERGEHQIVIGYAENVASFTSVHPAGDQPVAASGAWIDDATYQMIVYFTATPFHTTITCEFDDEAMIGEIKTNVGFEALKHTLVGSI